MSELLNINNKSSIIIGSSGSGKTHFTKSIIQKIDLSRPVHIFGNDENEWVDFIQNNEMISFHTKDPFESNYIFTLNNCVIIFDDYLQSKKTDNQFYKFVNYHVRHFNICFLLITHSIFKSNLYSRILSTPSIFLTTCSSNIFLAQKFDKLFNTKLTEILKKNILEYTNTYRPIIYATSHFLVNNIQELILPTVYQNKVIMFRNEKSYYLLDVNKYQFEEKNETSTHTKLDEVLHEFEEMYPKRFKKLKKFILQMFEFSSKKKILDIDSMEITITKPSHSFYDFIISSQDFSKTKLDPKTKAILLYLKKNNFKVPRFTLNNKHFRNYIS